MQELESNPSASGKVILHSDQDSQYTSQAFTEYCEAERITQSMSKSGRPYDNAPMESFYGTFKAEFIEQHSFEDDEQLNQATLDYILLLQSYKASFVKQLYDTV